MGETVPRHPCTGCHDRASLRTSANLIDEREAAIEARTAERALISEESLFSRIRKIGRVWDIALQNSHDRQMVETVERYADNIRGEELDACPGLYCRDVVMIEDPDGLGDITREEFLCGTRARLDGVDVSPESGWRLANPPQPPVRLDQPRDIDEY